MNGSRRGDDEGADDEIRSHPTARDPRASRAVAADLELRALTDAAVDAIVSADARGRIIDWNPAAERMFGYDRSEALGESLELLIPPRFRERHRIGMRRVVAGEPGRVLGSTQELEAVRSNGELFPVELSLSSWVVDEQRFFTGIIRDITRRKRTGRELERSTAELRARNAELEKAKARLQETIEQLERMYGVLAELLEGHIVGGRYQLERRLRVDAVGALYAATDLEQRVAVDLRICRAPHSDPEPLSSRRLGFVHPNAGEILDAGLSEVGLPYLVMEPLSGETLATWLERGETVRRSRAARWCSQVLEILEAAHAQGIVHGRVAPSAVFLRTTMDDPEPVATLVDFSVDALTCRGFPERKRRELGPYWPGDGPCPADRACDVHGAAVLILRLTTGIEPPPTGGFEPELGEALGLPASLVELLSSALSPRSPANDEERPSVGDLAAALGELTRAPR